MTNSSDQLHRLLRGTTNVVSEDELKKKLSQGKPLRVKLGVDPTAPDIHLGHAVVLTKLRVFQELGHKVVFIIGDFTARIGDPSGRDATRPPLSNDRIQENIKTYEDQIFKVLDQSESKLEIRRNSEWLQPLFDPKNRNFIMNSLLRQHTVQQLMERDDFTARRKAGQPISLLELLYPLFQGYDSVAVQSDVELGGNDQLFNLLMGREMQKDADQVPQVILTLPLLEGLDGVRKMSKSYNNHVGIEEPANQMFAKLMSISDVTMWKYFELLTEEDLSKLKAGHPMEAKKHLSSSITERFHNAVAAQEARIQFEKVFSNKETPEDIEEFAMPQQTMDIVELLLAAELAPSKKEARRLLDQGGVQIDGKKVDFETKVAITGPAILKVGKRRFKRLLPA